MNFINDRKLARRLNAGQVSSMERFYYFLIFLMIFTALCTSCMMSLLQTPLNQWDVVTDIFMLVTTLAGTIFLYRTNAKGDNREFIERYICLSLPIAVQALLLAILRDSSCCGCSVRVSCN